MRTVKLPILSALCCSFFTLSSFNTYSQTRVDLNRSFASSVTEFSDVVIIDRSSIEMSSAMTLTELLRGQSGIQISDNNAGAIFSLRGFNSIQAANNVLFVIDGRRLNNNDIAAPILNAINVEQIQRIEILSGSGGVRFGDQAVAGVINIITQSAESDTHSVGASIGTFDHYRVRANVGEVFDSGWRYYLSGHYDEHDGYRDHNAKKHSSISGRVGYDSKNTSVELEMSHYDSRVDIAGNLTLEEFEQNPRQANSFNGNDYMHDMSMVARLGVDHQLNESWFLDVEIDYTDTQVNNRNWDARTEHERTRLAVEPKLVFYHRLSAGKLQVTHGIDLAHNKTRYNWGRENKQSIIAVYAEAQIPLLKKLSGLIGGRYSKSKEDLTDAVIYPQQQSMDQSANAFSLGLSYQLSEDQHVYLKAEDNFRFAKVDEQAYTSPTVIGLKPQKGRSYELGWHLKHKQHQLQMDLYRLELEDEIVWDPLAPKPIGSQFEGANVNADSSRRLGGGVDWLWNMNSSLIVGAEYDYVDAIHTKGSYRDYAISGVSEHTARAHADISITDYWSLFLETIFTGSRYPEGDGFNQTQKISSYTLVNAALQYRRKEWLAGIRADNLFDKDYISASYFSPFGNGYYVGTGTRVRLDVSYRF